MDLQTSSPDIGLDDNGTAYRRLYFLRASLRTLAEIQETIQGLQAIEKFREMIAREPKVEQAVRDYHRTLNHNLDELRRVRNNLGGHVSGDAVESALRNVEFLSETGKFCIGRTHNQTHYRFANTLCAHVLMDSVERSDREEYCHRVQAKFGTALWLGVQWICCP